MLQNEIRHLNDELINQIKAGEVVERPYNVIKELVENSIDAGSKHISIELLDGGKQMIRIADDGYGMSAKNLSLALERHATSKISQFKDLDTLLSFGFRGEALPSIASVSHFSIKSRPHDQDLGREITLNCGKRISEKDVSTSVGTTVQVKDLFSGVPVRLKFLKSTATEFAHIHDFLTAVSLAFYNITFRLSHNGREVFNYKAKNSSADRFTEIFNFNAKDFTEINYTRGSFKLTGFIGLPHTAKTTPSHFITFVNGRYVKDKIVRTGVIQAYQGLLLKGLVAPAIIFVEVDPSWVDVNAHPSKVEVRFYDNAVIQDLIYIGIQNTLKEAIHNKASRTSTQESNDSHPSLPKVESVQTIPKYEAQNYQELSPKSSAVQTIPKYEKTLSSSLNNSSNSNQFKKDYSYNLKGNSVGKLKTDETSYEKNNILNDKVIEKTSPRINQEKLFTEIKTSIFDSAIYLGQFAQCFLLLEISKELWIIDQHAFHERILFEELIVSHMNKMILKQQLLTPVIIPSTEIISEIISEDKNKIDNLGFQIEILKNNHIAIHSFPSFLTPQKIPEVFDEIIARILTFNGIPQTEIHPLIEKAQKINKEFIELNMQSQALDSEKIYHLLFATIACHSAVRAGDPLNEELVKRLLGRAKDVDFYAHCPHGRPVIRKFSEKDISTWFQRT
ncbi:DNA mismatch repair endonuclease MutL [Fluviispira sanaruensis]|uniref:DNA mismatch repair protein MutL n=1 Tax=Fluviispira sanaruensis TaxID=2493639 RepID=A0A4P2VU36_FLUSA|nr:DNA mismatch repair endonuclease MutL [Fluviispira sanaruensis]BBH52945.1 DNA mismatch repair endonuclease MutL [Fluviispira sanaruensis]